MSRNSVKVLVVDDANSTRRLLHSMLTRSGFKNVVEAATVDGAIKLLSESSLDGASINLILSDWEMPGKSGYDFLCEVRKMSGYENVPFIMLTANDEINYIKKAALAGVNDYIIKPYSPVVLELKILSVLGIKPDKTI